MRIASSSSGGGSARGLYSDSLSSSPRSHESFIPHRGSTHGSPANADRGLRLDSPMNAGRGLPPPSLPPPSLMPRSDSPLNAEYSRVPDLPATATAGVTAVAAVRGSPLRPTLTLFASGSGTGSPCGSAGSVASGTGTGVGLGLGLGLGAAAAGGGGGGMDHRRRPVSIASGSDEIIGRLEFDDPSHPEGRGVGYARPYPYR